MYLGLDYNTAFSKKKDVYFFKHLIKKEIDVINISFNVSDFQFFHPKTKEIDYDIRLLNTYNLLGLFSKEDNEFSSIKIKKKIKKNDYLIYGPRQQIFFTEVFIKNMFILSIDLSNILEEEYLILYLQIFLFFGTLMNTSLFSFRLTYRQILFLEKKNYFENEYADKRYFIDLSDRYVDIDVFPALFLKNPCIFLSQRIIDKDIVHGGNIFKNQIVKQKGSACLLKFTGISFLTDKVIAQSSLSESVVSYMQLFKSYNELYSDLFILGRPPVQEKELILEKKNFLKK